MPSPTSSSSTSNVNPAGVTLIDALLAGIKWGGQTGSGVVLTYSFPWANGSASFSGPNGSGDYSTLNEPNASEHYAFNTAQQYAAELALQSWASVANLQFQQVADTASSVGDIRFGVTSATNAVDDGSQAWGWAQYPNPTYPSAGDIWISSDGAIKTGSWAASSYNYMSLMHEIGHALGLKHPFEDGVVLPASQDNRSNTIMSYTDPANDLFRSVTYNADGSYNWRTFYVNPETPMVLDVATMQYLYGANKSFHATDDVYTFDPHAPFIKTIWDASGNDTISVSNFTESCVIDLTPGSYSSIRILSDAAPSNYNGPTPTYNGTHNLGIAFGTIIENAVGGKGDDVLTGNDAANKLTGGGGNDQLDGGKGMDTAIYAGGRAHFTISKNSAGYTVSDNSGVEGTDTLSNVERLQFADAAVALDINGVAGEAYRIYQAAFDRTPDLAGLGYWIRDMDSGVSLTDVAAGFIQSAEFQRLYGAHPSNVTLLTNLYQNVLHRASDPGGFDYWIKELDAGHISAAGILASFSESTENQLQVIGKISNGIDYTIYA